MNVTMSLASAAGYALLHSLWEVALLAMLAWLNLASLRGAPASTRHAVGMCWLVSMPAAPIITFGLCWHAPTLLDASGYDTAQLAIESADLVTPSAITGAQSGWQFVCIAQLWLLGVGSMVVRQVGGWQALRRIECQAFDPLPPAWLQRVDSLSRELGLLRRVEVRVGEGVGSPFTARAWRPVIWIPLTLLTQWPRDQAEALLAHELAHIRRLDWCWNALQWAIEAMLFHHPGMWWLSRRIREEREHACDDVAVSVCGDPVVLAEALAALQRLRRPPVNFALALAAEGGSLMKRVAHLLSVPPTRPNLRWPGALLLLLCSGGLLATNPGRWTKRRDVG